MSTQTEQAVQAAVSSPATTAGKEQPSIITPPVTSSDDTNKKALTAVPTTVDDKKSTESSTPPSSSSTQVSLPTTSTELVGSNGEKVVIGDNYIHITYTKNKDSKNNNNNTTGNTSNDDDNIILDGEASATLAEATSEIAAAASDASPAPSSSPSSTTTSGNKSDESKLNDEDRASLTSLNSLVESITERIATFERSIKKLADHIIQLISLSSSWNTRSSSLFGSFGKVFDLFGDLTHQHSLSTSVRAAKLISEKMEAEAKTAREWVATVLPQAESFKSSSNDSIKAKYDEVKAKVDSFTQTCDKIIGRASHAASSFTHLLQRRVPSPSTTENASKEVTDKSAADTKRTPEASAKVTTVTEKPVEKVRVRWSPDFLSRELLDGVLITSTLPGLTADHLHINVDEQKRILHINGQRTVKQRVIDHEATAAAHDDDDISDLFDLGFGLFGGRHRNRREPVTKLVEVEQWFDEKLQLPKWLDTNTDKYRTSIDPHTGHFSIAIPKVEVVDSKRQAVPVTPRVAKQVKPQKESKEEAKATTEPTPAAAPTVAAESVAPAAATPSTTTSSPSSSSSKDGTGASSSSPSPSKKRQASSSSTTKSTSEDCKDDQKCRRRRVSPSPEVWAYVDDAADLLTAFQPFHPRHVYHPTPSRWSHPFVNVSPFTSSFPFAW